MDCSLVFSVAFGGLQQINHRIMRSLFDGRFLSLVEGLDGQVIRVQLPHQLLKSYIQPKGYYRLFVPLGISRYCTLFVQCFACKSGVTLASSKNVLTASL